MLIAFAVLGWLLFIFAATLYWKGNRINSIKLNGLELLCLTSILSDEWHAFNKEKCIQLLENHGDPDNIDVTVYAMMNGLTLVASEMATVNLELARKVVKTQLSISD